MSSVFSERFVLLGLAWERRSEQPPQRELEIRVNRSINGPALGKCQLAVFFDADTTKVFGRLYHFDSRETAWYDLTLVEGASAYTRKAVLG